MDQQCVDTLEIFLRAQKQKLNYHEVESDIETGKKWKKAGTGALLKSKSIRVTVVKRLRELTDDGYLKKEELGHKNVQYSFKNKKAREKAERIVHPSAAEWEKTISAALQWSIPREGGLYETVEPTVLVLPGAMLVGYFYRIIDSIIQNDPNDLLFYQKQAMATLGLYWDSLVKAFRKEPRKQLREVLEIAKKNGETDLLPTKELELQEFLYKKFNTSDNRETPPDSRDEEESDRTFTSSLSRPDEEDCC